MLCEFSGGASIQMCAADPEVSTGGFSDIQYRYSIIGTRYSDV